MESVKNSNGRRIVLAMVTAVQDNRQYLGDLDGLIGDGDHGANMNKGFSTYAAQLGDGEVRLCEGLFDLGGVLLNQIGGSMGPIYGTIFMEMSEAAGGKENIALSDFTEMLEAGMSGLYDLVEARPGDKTLVDTLDPAVKALKAAQAAGKTFYAALDDMAAAAERGKESTRDMAARYGRAARLGERSRGVLDAGATSCCIILKAMASAMQELLTVGEE